MARLKERFSGCLLGGAIGDALGYPVEFMSREAIEHKYGPGGVKDFTERRYFNDKALISDDTQMTLFTANGLMWAAYRIKTRGFGDWISSGIWPAYLRWLATQSSTAGVPKQYLQPQAFEDKDDYIMAQKELFSNRAPGCSCLSALRSGMCGDLNHPINNSKGCGSVMRVAPVGLYFYDDPDMAFWVGAKSGAITHGHRTGQLAAGAAAEIIARITAGENISRSVIETMKRIRRLKGGMALYNVLNYAMEAATVGVEPEDAIPTIGGGWTADEALGIAVFCAVYADTLNDALLLAVNHDGDSDSTGAICGNIVGAAYGMNALRISWLCHVELGGFIMKTADALFEAARDKGDLI